MKTNLETVLKVEGMSCGSCVRHINAALRVVTGVREVDVQLASGQVVVRHDADAANVGAYIEALQDAGYPSSLAA